MCASVPEQDFTKQVLLFSVDKAHPHNIVVPRGAPRAPKSSIGMTLLNTLKFYRASCVLRVHLEGAEGGNDESCLPTPEIFIRDDLFTLRSWSPERLEMHFGSVDGLEASAISSELAQRVISDLVEAHGLRMAAISTWKQLPWLLEKLQTEKEEATT